jgi:acid phosphatase class B
LQKKGSTWCATAPIWLQVSIAWMSISQWIHILRTRRVCLVAHEAISRIQRCKQCVFGCPKKYNSEIACFLKQCRAWLKGNAQLDRFHMGKPSGAQKWSPITPHM